MLKKDQKRGLTIALRVVEENMQNIERILNSETHKGILYDTKCTITPEIKEEMLKRVSLVKDRIKILSNLFALEKEYREGLRKIFGILPSCWEIIENVKSKRLKRYGDVQDGLDNVLDPQLNMITDLVLEMEQLLGRINK
ncbi:MAG: hypothetical protein HYV59_10465 [Planctomycetes bacterium]|nr:hypothetical protein [Planctomycetota bacterium]